MKNITIKFISIIMVLIMLFSNLVFAQTTEPSQIVISEIGAHEKTDYEWIEIYNASENEIDLTGWKFYEDETNHALKEFQNGLTISPNEYAVIADVPENFLETHPYFAGTLIDSSWTSLKLTGEEIGIKDALGDLIESFTYSEILSNSLQKINLSLTDYTLSNWASHATSDSAGKENEFVNNTQDIPTPIDLEETPVTTAPQEDQDISNTAGITSAVTTSNNLNSVNLNIGDIIINEFVSDAESGEKEWIELFNTTQNNLSIDNLILKEGSGAKIKLNGEILANNYYVYEFSRAKLNNKGDEIILTDSQDKELDYVSYGDWNEEGIIPAPTEKFSLARNENNEWILTDTKTPNEKNKFSKDDVLQQNTDAKNEQKIEIKPTIIINEIFPNPIGSDRFYEFIEIKNISDTPQDITSWVIKSKSGQRYIIPNLIINAGNIVTFERSISNIALNNITEELRILNNKGDVIDKVEYKNINFEENYSYQKIDKEWKITTRPTKNQENIDYPINIKPLINLYCETTVKFGEELNCDASDSYDPNGDTLRFEWNVLDKNENILKKDYSDILKLKINDQNIKKIFLTVKDGQNESSKMLNLKITNIINEVEEKIAKEETDKNSVIKVNKLDDVKNIKNGSQVIAKGTVSVTPNTFGKNLIFLSGSGMQIVSENGNWPELQEGDYVEVTGKVSESYGQKAIKITDLANISIIENNNPPDPVNIPLSDVGEKYESYLVKLKGEISNLQLNSFYLKDEKNNVYIYIKRNTSISLKELQEGEEIEIIGIITQQKEGYEVYPRSQNDIIKINTNSNPQENEVIGELEEKQISKNSESGSVIKILGITILMLIIILIVIIRLRTLSPTPLQTRSKGVGDPPKKRNLINTAFADK